MNKIALEEHFAIDEYNGTPGPPFLAADVYDDVRRRIVDFDNVRLPEMDQYGIEYSVISLTSPGVQGETDAGVAVTRARKANDALALSVSAHPDRFGAFAALPLQDVDAAVAELDRCVTELGFHGALVNSHTSCSDNGGVAYLDEPQFEPLWEKLESLGVPLYLHPRQMIADERTAIRDRPELTGPVWEFTVDASASAMRLITSGLFDRHPTVDIILGHLGETLPFNAWRIDNRLLKAADRPNLERTVTEYLQNNFFYTTSGHFSTASLRNTIDVVGIDRVMFSTDYPYDEMGQASKWFDNADIDESVRRQVGSENARKLFSLRG